jgi:hypothetical protein
MFMAARVLLMALAVSYFLPAQTPAPSTATPDGQATAASGPQSPEWHRLSVAEKLRYDARHLFDIDNLIYAAIGAGLDQVRDRPDQWGQGGGAYAERYASHVGQYLIQRSIMFPVQAIDHEDPRYFRSNRKSFKGRVGDAFLHTVWRHDDSGGMMPAYGEFLGDYGAAAISRMWWPANYHKGSSVLVAGSDTLLIDAGINVIHEFAPDIKRKLHLGH